MNPTSPDPKLLGQIFALVFLSVLVLAVLGVLVMGVVGLRRRNINPRCAWALIMELGPFFAFGAVAPFFAAPEAPAYAHVIMAVMGCFMFAGMVGGPAIAVLGLIQFYKQPRRWPRGALVGWTATIIPLVLIASAMLNALVNLEAPSQAASARGLSGPSKWLPRGAVRTPDGRWRFPGFNFELRPPPGNWTSQNPMDKDSPHILMQKFRPRRVFEVVSEKLPVNIPGGTSKWLAHYAENFVRGIDAEALIQREVPITIGSLPGIQFEADQFIDGMRSFRIQWCFSRQGWAYQLQLRGPQAEADAIRREATGIFASFAQIDTNRAAPGWEYLSRDQFRSTNDPFTVNLAGHEWRPFPNVAGSYPAADFAAFEEHDFDLVVLPFALPQPTPTFTPEAITGALLAPSPFGSQAKNLQGRTSWHAGELQGETVTLDRNDVDEPWLGRLRFVWGRQTAWLLVAGGAKKAGPTVGQLDLLLDRVVLEDVPAKRGGEELPPARRHSQGLFLNQLGLPAYRTGRMAQAEDLFRLAGDLSPENPVYLANQCDALASLKQYSNGLVRLESRLPMVLTNLPLRATRARFQLHTGDTNAALLQYQETFEAGFTDEDQLSIFLQLLLDTGRTNDARAQMEAFARTHLTTSAQLLQAKLLREVDDLPGAIRLLRVERDRSGLSADLGYALADLLLEQGDAAAAYEVCEALLARGYETAESWTLRGRAEIQLKRLPEAKKSLETAAKLDPGDAGIRARLVRVSALQGQGDSSGIKTPLPPVNLPEELTRNWPAPLQPDQISPQGAQYLDNTTAIHFESGKERRETSKWRVAIYDRVGLERFGTLAFDFDPLHEEIYVNELVVRDGAGQVVATGKVDDYYVSDDSAHALQAIASHRKQLNVPVPGLQPGRMLELTITRRDLAPPDEFQWLDELFERQTPAARLLTYVEGDVDRLRWETSSGIKPLRGDHYLAWQCDHTPAAVVEPLEPVSSVFRPKLWVTDSQLTWRAEITNYLALLAEKLGPDAETRAAHSQATAGITGRKEQIRALAKFVQSHCTYRAIEFGRRARVPNHAGETLSHHYGDCKDQAVLLHELLALSGVPSHLVLANSAQPVHTNLPSLDQFNHMLVFVPGEQGGRFVDTTGQSVDPFITPSLSLGGRAVLVLDPANPHFADVPPLGPDSARVSIEREVKVTDGTDVLIEEEVTATGVAAAWFRIVLNESDGSSFKTQAQRLLGGGTPACEVESLEGKGFDDNQEAVRFHFKARIRNQFQRVGERLVGTLPVVWEPFWFAAGSPMERRAPLEIRQPYQVEVQTSLVLPTGYDWPEARKSAAMRQGDFADTSMGVSGRGDAWLLTSKCALHTGVFPAVRHEERRQALTEAMRLLAPSVVLEKGTLTTRKK